jgi:hypothetical protein
MVSAMPREELRSNFGETLHAIEHGVRAIGQHMQIAKKNDLSECDVLGQSFSLQSHKDAKGACVLDFKPMSEEVAGKAV